MVGRLGDWEMRRLGSDQVLFGGGVDLVGYFEETVFQGLDDALSLGEGITPDGFGGCGGETFEHLRGSKLGVSDRGSCHCVNDLTDK